jgi:hypothetical protein
MSRAQEFMKCIWDAREMGADTEEKLVAFILRLASGQIKSYSAQNGITVLDQTDMTDLANEIENLNATP